MVDPKITVDSIAQFALAARQEGEAFQKGLKTLFGDLTNVLESIASECAEYGVTAHVARVSVDGVTGQVNGPSIVFHHVPGSRRTAIQPFSAGAEELRNKPYVGFVADYTTSRIVVRRELIADGGRNRYPRSPVLYFSSADATDEKVRELVLEHFDWQVKRRFAQGEGEPNGS